MKVCCRKIVEPATGRSVQSSEWVTLGKTYSVLTIAALPEGIRVRFLADDGSPVVWSGENFEVVEPMVPIGWAIRIDPLGLTCGPPALIAPGFWERFFDGDPDAVDEVAKHS